MSKNALKRLTIEHLRGAVKPFTLTFEKGKSLTIIYGENGAGKSTICDAFEFLGNGKVGSLDNRGLGKTNRYWPSVDKAPADVAVTFETASAECTATLKKSEVSVAPPEHRPRVKVLRRSQILSLVEATPASRYDTISQYIDISGVETSEAALNNSIKEVESSYKITIAELQESLKNIDHFWEEAGRPGNHSLAWAEAEAQKEHAVFDTEISAIERLGKAFARIAEYPKDLAQADEELRIARESLALADRQLEQALATVTADAANVVSLLEAARKYFAGRAADPICPLCESADKADNLPARIGERLVAFATLRTAQAEKTAKENAFRRASERIEDIRKNGVKLIAHFEEARKDKSLPAVVPLPFSAFPDNVSDWGAWLAENAGLPAEWKRVEIERQDKKQFLGTLKRAFQTCQENTIAAQDQDRILPRLKRAQEIVRDLRREFTDATLSSIATEVGRLYEAIHPGEGLDKISLELDPKKRASLEIGASFCGQGKTPPQAYFSDSHLDTLGLCVFLALAAMESPEETILVLDDVIASVDEPHVDRLIELLYQEADRFQHCVFTTHYRPWKQKLRWGWLQNGQCHFVELSKWSDSTGMTLIRSVPDLERLRLLLAEPSPDSQLVCAKAGVLLEAALEFLTIHYECKAPRRLNGLYTLGDLLPAVDKKLRSALRVDVLPEGQSAYTTLHLGPYLDELTRIAQARNIFGCHFNQLSFDLLDDDALRFGRQVLELMGALTDEGAGWPRNGKSGEFWATTGETRRLHPYKKPE